MRYDGTERTPLVARAPHALGIGAWLVTATVADRSVTLPIFVARGSSRRLALALPAAIPDGFVYMPAGDAMFGSADAEALRAWSKAVAAHVVQTPGYLIAKHETTFLEWTQYLEALSPEERELRRPRIVSTGTGVRGGLELLRTKPGEYRLVFQPADLKFDVGWDEPVRYPDRTNRAVQDWRRFPVAGVSFEEAIAYTKWLAATGRVPHARLCSEIEWERAARGTSTQRFPHGDTMKPDDANIDVTYGKQPRNFGLDEVGSHPSGTSPFGVADLAGNVWEWTTGSVTAGQSVARGGSYYFDAYTARVTNRETPEASYRGSTVGFRVCASLSMP
jgi:formylglycine-generating enzyme required for sulfatase activity